MKARLVTLVGAMAGVSILSACSGDTKESTLSLRATQSESSDDLDLKGAARLNYEKAAADYRYCLASNPYNRNACEGQREIMQSKDAMLSSSPEDRSSSNATAQRP